jgi:hypothetical protein
VLTLLTPSSTDSEQEAIFDRDPVNQTVCTLANFSGLCDVLVGFSSTTSTATGDAASLFSDSDLDDPVNGQPGSFAIAELQFQAVGAGGTTIAFSDLNVSLTAPDTVAGLGLIVGVLPEPGVVVHLGLALIALGAGLRPRLAG